jgi:hypothetical protein
MKFYENIEFERERIQNCISRFGWTSDHNLDWYTDVIIEENTKPVFVEFNDGTGLLAHKCPDKWRIWSDPLSEKNIAPKKISEFCNFVLTGNIKEVWCDDVSDKIYPELKKDDSLKLNDIYYSLLWLVLDMEKYDISLAGKDFKRIRNAKNKFYREHEVKIFKTSELPKQDLIRIVDIWKEELIKRQKEDIYDLRFRKVIENNFRGFTTARVMIVDGRPVGINAGYEVPNHPGRFAGIIGIHDYSEKELGRILWLEDLEWIKNAGYKELDMQGNEDGLELKAKTQYGAVIERKTDTFSIVKNS